MRSLIKLLLNRTCQLLVLPLGLICWLEAKTSKGSEVAFLFFAHSLGLLPGLPGVFIRRAYYFLTLDKCSEHSYIGFGSMFTHRSAEVGKHVYIGAYSIVGSAILGDNSFIGSRVSILSGKNLHSRTGDGEWTPFSAENIQQVKLGPNIWVGEGAIIMADVGYGSMIGAGAVVTTNVRDNIIVAGNPARFVRNLEQSDSDKLAS